MKGRGGYRSIHTESDWWVWILMFFLPRRQWYREHYLVSRHWRTLRRRKLKSVSNRCERCHSTPAFFDVHHLTYKQIWHEWLSDLEVLCRSCHKKEHENDKSIYRVYKRKN